MFTMPILLLGAVSLPNWALIAGLVGLAFVGGKLIFRADDKVENLKRDAIQISQIAANEGLPLTAGILEDAAVGDLSGMVIHVRELGRQIRDEGTRKQLVMAFLEKQLAKHLDDAEKREALLARIESKLGVKIPRSPTAAVA